ncbi:MAG: hypothetical protein P8176_09000 [Gammaproteobacteria bacterium]
MSAFSAARHIVFHGLFSDRFPVQRKNQRFMLTLDIHTPLRQLNTSGIENAFEDILHPL